MMLVSADAPISELLGNLCQLIGGTLAQEERLQSEHSLPKKISPFCWTTLRGLCIMAKVKRHILRKILYSIMEIITLLRTSTIHMLICGSNVSQTYLSSPGDVPKVSQDITVK
uniref:Uncharacterized protein n=1 Tax=Callorhinchus milii TaxID=7868 RepID=A0A4W3GUK5_CALMI